MNPTKHRPRRKPGAVEGTYRPPAPGSSDDTPLRRRRHLIRWLRAHPELDNDEFRLLESYLDRVPIQSTSPVTWDSIETAARRCGISESALIIGHRKLASRGMILRLSHRKFEAWLDRVGRSLGFEYPAEAGRPQRFTILLCHLPEDDSRRARVCAPEAPSHHADLARKERGSCAPVVADLARPLPISGTEVFEPGELNRRRDEKLEGKGGGEAPKATPAETRPDLPVAVEDEPGWAETLARLKALTPMGRRAKAETPARPVAAQARPQQPDEPRPLAAVLGAVPDMAKTPPQKPPRVSGLVRDLPGADRSAVDRVALALMRHFRDSGNEITRRTFGRYLDCVRLGELSADLVVALIDDVDRRGIDRPANLLSQSLADEYRRKRPESARSRTDPKGKAARRP